jgi:putative heme iron utilization protein
MGPQASEKHSRQVSTSRSEEFVEQKLNEYCLESIAEYLERPLLPMALTTLVGGHYAGDSLKTIFQAAVEWNAILLLDEADVVLEARSFEDVHRNASVSSESS